MRTFILQAPRTYIEAGIYEGYILQVPSQAAGPVPSAAEVAAALRRAGFDRMSERVASPGNWIVRELKIKDLL